MLQLHCYRKRRKWRWKAIWLEALLSYVSLGSEVIDWHINYYKINDLFYKLKKRNNYDNTKTPTKIPNEGDIKLKKQNVGIIIGICVSQ